MKNFRLILAGCVAFIGVCCAAHSDVIGDVTRVASRRVPVMTPISTNRNQNNTDNASRLNSATSNTVQNVRGRTTTTRSPITTERNATTRNTTGNVVSRTTAGNMATRTATQTSRSTTRNATPVSGSSRTVSRATSVTREDILNRDYSKCKKVFFDCMDEFCANKDAQLKRCACSSRINEFDSVKKQLAAVEDKMLDFNQKLLTVSMEKEDAAALNIATEGETAFLSTKDNTKSKQTLDAIKKKLNTSFDSSNFDDNNLQVLSWSLDVDAAFDNVDSLMGASTASKSGTALYSAALPVCRQMAAEVCNETDVSLAEGGYQALIEQDCNTVAKTYKTQTTQARTKVQEGSALLDMSRLDVYQKRNSDDILTCKKKMLDMLTDSTVCGDELGKCLDVTGQYINPTTGEVFLTPQLINLTTLLSRPDDNATWSTTAKNSTFVTFLNSKKKFLQPATEHCQNVADAVWDSFIEDALAQIKLAQDKKLNTVRQSCTVLTAQCLSDATATLTKFDSRALSTFGIAADATVNAMCADVINSCTALLNTTDDGDQWNAGVSEITRTTTYETLMETCRQVGRACIVQVCSSSSGNFGLCENIDTSTNRKSIINRDACWNEVKECIRSAGSTSIDDIFTNHLKLDNDNTTLNFYASLYEKFNSSNIITNADTPNYCTTSQNESSCVFDICVDDCTENSDAFTCRTCRLAERIWGNCEFSPQTSLSTEDAGSSHNKIKKPKDTKTSTLLYWFAVNTGTESALDNCRDTTCAPGYARVPNENGTYKCIKVSNCFSSYTGGRGACPEGQQITTTGSQCLCCTTQKDSAGNCCTSNITISETFTQSPLADQELSFCASSLNSIVITEPYTTSDDKTYVLICDSTATQTDGVTLDSDGTFICDGTLIQVQISQSQEDGKYTFHYLLPTKTNYAPERYYNGQRQCAYNNTNGQTWFSAQARCDTPDNWFVVFDANQ